jgi:hypothetical protein
VKKILFSMLAVLVTLALVVPAAVLADQQQVDCDIYSPGNQNIVSLTATTGDTVTTQAEIIVTRSGNNHLLVGDPVNFVDADAGQTTLPDGYSVSSVSGAIPSPWDKNGLVYEVGWSIISFTAPETPGSYSYAVKWNDTHDYGNKLTGGDAFVIYLTVEEEEAGPYDVTPPVITINVPADGATYILNEPVLADWTAVDPESPVTIDFATAANGAAIDTATVGSKSFTVTAHSDGGSSTLTNTYSVVYNFGGFLPPLVINGHGNGLFKAGSTIPVKFQLTDFYGNPVSTASGTASIDTSSPATAPIHYDADAQQYVANLKTPKGATGSYTITVNLDDGMSYTIGVTLK